MRETFQDWIQTTARNYRNTPGMITGRLHPLTDYKAQEGAKLAWDHQQEKINELLEEAEKLIDLHVKAMNGEQSALVQWDSAVLNLRSAIAKAKGEQA